MRIIPVAIALSLAIASSGCVDTQAAQKQELSKNDPSARQKALIDDCTRSVTASASPGEKISPRTMCTRLVKAFADGRLTAADISGASFSPRALKIILGE